MPKPATKSTKTVRKKSATPSVTHEAWLLDRLKDPAEAAAYIEAAIEDGDQPALMMALRHVAQAQGGIAKLARKSKLTREATYRMLSASGNPELRSLTAILDAAGLRLSVKPIGRRVV
ncbi:MAG: putative addiction module antidote protein [Burkholderiales bacterium]|jgi:probable addiction module antidote protein|nr:putative addiction module antidote protein [Burkholderiales bacterium]